MKELERLAGELSRLTDTSRRHRAEGAPTIKDIDRAAAILLAASKVDVAGLMELVAKVSNAAYVAGLQDANGEGCDATAQTLFEDELETALRMALAQREWVGLTDAEIYQMYNEPRSDSEMVTFGREVEAKLKEKNHD